MERLDFANCHFTKADIEEYVFDYDFLIAEDKEGKQLGVGGETLVRQSGSIFEAPRPGQVLEEDED